MLACSEIDLVAAMENDENDCKVTVYKKLVAVENGCELYFKKLEVTAGCKKEDFTQHTFNRQNLTKARLSDILFNYNNMVTAYADVVVQLRSVVDQFVAENDKLKTATIQAQDNVISIQKELLACKDKQLDVLVQDTVSDAVKSSVEQEIKSYSQVVTSSQTGYVPSVKAVKQAVEEVVQAEDRSKNLIMFGLPEEPNEETCAAVSEVLEILGEKPRQESVRIGVKAESNKGRPRPVKISLSSSAHVIHILRAAKNLKNSEHYKEVFICPDRTVEEQKARRDLVAKLKQKVKEEPDKRHFIRDGKILTVVTKPK